MVLHILVPTHSHLGRHSTSSQLSWIHKEQTLSLSKNCSPSTPLLTQRLCGNAGFLFMVGEIKKLEGVGIHGSHIFKNSLASSRQGPEHGCSRPVMLTQQAGTLHHLLPASSLPLPSKAGYLNTPFQQVPKHSSEPPQFYQTPDTSKDAASMVQ